MLVSHIEVPAYGILFSSFVNSTNNPYDFRDVLRTPVKWRHAEWEPGKGYPTNEAGGTCPYFVEEVRVRPTFADFIELDPVSLMVTYVPWARRDIVNEQARTYGEDWKSPWHSPFRQSIKPGRFLRSFLSDETLSQFSESDIEQWANAVKAYGERQKCTIEVVRGDDLADWYRQQSCGVRSCMQGNPASYFELYAANPDHISLMVAYDDEGTLIGRALVWTLNNGQQWMDRIYGSDHIQALMAHEAQQRGFTDHYSGYVPISHTHCYQYPYLDTFMYLVQDGPDKGLYDSHESGSLTLQSQYGGYLLTCTECGEECESVDDDGLCDDCSRSRSCDYCGERKEDRDSDYCNHCLDNQCRDCGDIDSQSFECGYCWYCRKLHVCVDCGDVDESVDQDEDGYCDSCRDKNTCQECLRIVKQDDDVELCDAGDLGMLCSTCLDKLTVPNEEDESGT